MFRQIDLRSREDRAFKQWNDWRAEMDREIVRLIESAGVFAARMQRDRDNAIGFAQHLGATLTHQRAEPRRNRAPAIVFQRVNDVLHPPVVLVHGGGPADGVRGVEAEIQRLVPNAGPAHVADRPVERVTEAFAARRTRRLKQRG